MKIYIIYHCYHYDDYKRADSAAGIDKVFTNEDDAYDFANNKLLLMFEDYAKYTTGNPHCQTHIMNEYLKNMSGLMYCEECIVSINEDCKLNLEHEDNLFSRYHIISVINDKTKSNKEIYRWIQDNLYDNILNKPEYTMMPSHINYFVHEENI